MNHFEECKAFTSKQKREKQRCSTFRQRKRKDDNNRFKTAYFLTMNPAIWTCLTLSNPTTRTLYPGYSAWQALISARTSSPDWHPNMGSFTSTKSTKTHIHKLQPQTTTNMNSMVMSSRKAVVARPANSRRVAAAAARNGSRVTMANSMQVLRPEKKYECLSYLPPLSDADIAKQVDYLVGNGWSPCIEFASQEEADTNQLFFAGPALYENRYWTMWKLPMFGCQSGEEVLKEIEECQKEYPGYRVRVVGFDRVRQVQMAGFIVRI